MNYDVINSVLEMFWYISSVMVSLAHSRAANYRQEAKLSL